MQQFETLTLALEDLLDGNVGLRETPNWEVTNCDTPIMTNLIYQEGKAVYGFLLDKYDDKIVLQNYHREALKGNGTSSLKELETSLEEIAKSRQKKVALVFQVIADQPDTIAWLEKNNYQQQVDQNPGHIYYKLFNY
jgi:hypothetical protein